MAGGFKLYLEDRGDLGFKELQAQADQFLFEGNRTPGLTNLMTTYRANSPQFFVDVNRDQCRAKQVEIRDVFNTLQVYLGSLYVNDFNKFGRTWQVIVQAQSRFRNQLEDVKQLRVRNGNGDMVPLGTLANVREINGPMILTRYNMYPAAAINGNTSADLSSGQGIELVQQLAARELSPAMRYEWTEITFMQVLAGNNIWNLLIFPLSVLAVFLVLAALYESWSLPLAVILVVPMCLLGSITGVALAGSDLNIFTQIGFVVLVGLASKNAILIVEFAKVKRERGQSRRAATLEACWLRLRPILMTSFAFILGVVPLLTASGAGAEMRRRLGTAVFSGMLGVTLFGIFLTPVFFFVINRLTEGKVLSSRTTRILSGSLFWAFIILTLGLAWLLPRGFRFLTRPPSRPRPPPR
jgi:multidrug efflux pump